MTIATEVNGFSLLSRRSNNMLERHRNDDQGTQNSFGVYLQKGTREPTQESGAVADPLSHDDDADVSLNLSMPNKESVIALRELDLQSDVKSFATMGVLLSRELAVHNIATGLPSDLEPLRQTGHSGKNTTGQTIAFADSLGSVELTGLHSHTVSATAGERFSAFDTSVATISLAIGSPHLTHLDTSVATTLQPFVKRSAQHQSVTHSTAQATASVDTSSAKRIRAELIQQLSRPSSSSVDVKIVRGETGLVLNVSFPPDEILPGKELERRLYRLVEAMGERVERIVYRHSHISNSTSAAGFVFPIVEGRD